jgi:hypothetical protein
MYDHKDREKVRSAAYDDGKYTGLLIGLLLGWVTATALIGLYWYNASIGM